MSHTSQADIRLSRSRDWRERGILAALGLAHGLLMSLALAPFGLWPVALVALVPIFVAIDRLSRATPRETRPARGAAWVALGTLPYWLYLHAFLIDVTAPGYPGLGVLLSFYVWINVWMAARAARALPGVGFVLAAIAWAGGEYFRGEIALDGYPWALVAHPLVEWFPLAAPAAVGGQYLLVLLVALLAAATGATHARIRARVVAASVTVVAWAVLSAFGHSMVPGTPGDQMPVGLVQTNVPQSNKMSWRIQDEIEEWKRLEAMTVQAAGPDEASRPDLIVWPETMAPGPTLEPETLETLAREQMIWNLPVNPADPSAPSSLRMTAFADRLLEMQQSLAVPMLIGEEAMVGVRVVGSASRISLDIGERFNSMYLIESGAISRTRYDKIRLTPFGEVMPYISAWPWLEKQLLSLGAAGMRFDLGAGTVPTVFVVRSRTLDRQVRIVTPICFEVTTGWVCREMVFEGGQRRADLMVSVSNDGWFGWWDAGREQHMQQARMRCIETGTPMVRAANTGVSGIIDARGRVIAQGVTIPAGGESGGAAGATYRVGGVLRGAVPLAAGTPLYARVGDGAGMLLLAASTILVVVSFVRSRGARGEVSRAATDGR